MSSTHAHTRTMTVRWRLPRATAPPPVGVQHASKPIKQFTYPTVYPLNTLDMMSRYHVPPNNQTQHTTQLTTERGR